MFAAARRLPTRVAVALAQRRRYIAAVLRGDAGTQGASFKLRPPWEETVAPKPLGDASRPIVRVLKYADVDGLKDQSRVTLKVVEKEMVVASFEMRPARDEACNLTLDTSDDEEGSDEGEEVWDEAWTEDGENISEDEFEEECIPGLERKSSGEEARVLFLGPLEMITDDDESIKRDVKSPRRVPSCFIMDLCLWPQDAVAHATFHRTDDKGDCIWQSSFCFSLEEYDNMGEELPEPQNVK